ncbi:helicase [Wallal virus]|uniref:Helicase n=1 Tax=Wallal virus TaxID=40061 RepID=U3RA86_9REOV|nr:helicase [Wallal virus]AGX00995.1 helicase [Wallal virus]
MTTVVLLAPGDVIQNSIPELKERRIQFRVKAWEKEDGSDAKNGDGGVSKQSEDGSGAIATAGENNKEEGKRGSNGGGDGINKGLLKGKDQLGDVPTERGRDIQGDSGNRTGAQAAKERTYVVLVDRIAQAIKAKLGGDVGVLANITDASETRILVLDRHVLKELGLDQEVIAQQKEVLQKIKRVNNDSKKVKVRGKKDQHNDKKEKDRSNGKEEEEGKGPTKKNEVESKKEDEGYTSKYEEVYSYKKLDELVGKKDRKEEVFTARSSGVRLVSNDIKDVAIATAYYTCPTGDTNWKEVARKAAEQSNIMAYAGKGENSKEEFIHLIDHL